MPALGRCGARVQSMPSPLPLPLRALLPAIWSLLAYLETTEQISLVDVIVYQVMDESIKSIVGLS